MKKFASLTQQTIIFLALLSLAGGAALGVVKTLKSRQAGKTAALFSQKVPVEDFLPSEEEIADLTKPAVVRIVHTVKGEAKIPSFSFDPTSLELIIDQKKILTVPIEYEITGSGFFVNPSGTIATNAQTISGETAKYLKISELFALSLEKNIFLKIEKGNLPALDETQKSDLAKKLRTTEFKRIIDESSFTITSDIKVLNPVSTKNSLRELVADGFPARIIRSEENFLENDRDVAIIKIEGSRYPSIPVGSDAALPIGRKIFAFEFPKTVEFNQKNPLEATFTNGIIQAVRDSQDGKFSIYQLDAKISQESSGGPLLDEKGNVKGLVTFETSVLEPKKEDNFASAIPVAVLSEALKKISVTPESGAYYKNLYAGIQAMSEKRCKEALEKFSVARETHGAFLPALVIKKYIDQCNQLIEAGESIDSRFDAIYNFFGTMGPLFWAIILIVIVGALAVTIVIFFFRRRIARDEEKMEELAGSQGNRVLPKTEKQGISDSVMRGEFAQKRKPAYLAFLTRREKKKDESAHSDAEFAAITYVKTQFAAGFSEEQIVRALRDAGWRDTAVNKIILFAKMK